MRFIPWYVFALAGLAGVWFISPMQMPVVLYKLSLVTIGLVGGYLADKTLFKRVPYAKVDHTLSLDTFGGMRLLARALIVFAVVLGVSHGL